MDIQSLLKNLHPLEIKVLKNFKIGEGLHSKKLQEVLHYKEGHANQAFSWLKLKDLIQEKNKHTAIVYELTELGKDYAKNGLPAERIIRLLKEAGPFKLPEIAQKLGLQNKDVGSSFGELSKAGCAAMNDEKKAVYVKDADDKNFLLKKELLLRAAKSPDFRLLETSLTEDEKSSIADIAKKRGAADAPFKMIERDEVVYTFTDIVPAIQNALNAAGITGEETGQLTSESLKTGAWKNTSFRSYNIQLPPARVIPGRTNPYADFLEGVKDKLTSLGFEELTARWLKRTSGIRMPSLCRSSMPLATFMTYITLKILHMQKQSKNLFYPALRKSTKQAATAAAAVGTITLTAILPVSSYCVVKERYYPPTSLQKRKSRANTSE